MTDDCTHMQESAGAQWDSSIYAILNMVELESQLFRTNCPTWNEKRSTITSFVTQVPLSLF